MRKITSVASFLRGRVEYDWFTGCWNWQGYKIDGGYGRCTYRNKQFLAHRLVLHLCGTISWRKLNAKNVVMHTCDNPSCCNPMHLKLGTQQENIKDRDNKGRTAKHLDRRDPVTKRFI